MKKELLLIITFLFFMILNQNVKAEEANELSCSFNEAYIPVPIYPGNRRAPSVEAVCISAIPSIVSTRTDAILSFSHLVPFIPGGYRCAYNSNLSPDEPVIIGFASKACLPPTLPEDDNEDENLGCVADPGVISDHPCNRATGNKFRAETDFNHPVLSFTRYYNSQAPASSKSLMGSHWNHMYQVRVNRSVNNRATFVTKTGRTETFVVSRFVVTQFENGHQNPDNDYHLEVSTDSQFYYKIIHPSGAQDQFYKDGRIAFSEDTKGNRKTYDYIQLDGFNYLEKVTDHYGHSIHLGYEKIPGVEDGFPFEDFEVVMSGEGASSSTVSFRTKFEYQRLNRVIDPFGAEYLYNYDNNHNLVEVIYPDTTPNDQTDNPRKTYHYENENFPNHLTGITDENGNRYANFAYNDEGKAILSELGVTTNQVGQEKIELEYQGAN